MLQRKVNQKVQRKLAFVIGLTLLLGTASVCGAEASDDSMESYDLGETVVTATRSKLQQKEVPMAVQVVTSEEMQKKGIYNVRDALKNVTSLDVSTNSAMVGNEVSIRGMGTTQTLILIDGRRMAGEDSPRTMNAYELNRINVNNIDRIEILRGSGSAVWGSDATGGVINIITKKNKKAGGYVGTRTGTEESSVYGGFSTGSLGKLNLNVDYNLSKIRERSEDGTTNQHGPRRNFSFDGDYRFNDHSGLSFGASFLKEQFRSQASETKVGKTFSWYDNNREDFHIKFYGFDNRNDWEVQSYYNRLGKEGRTRSTTRWQDFNHAKYSTWVNEAHNTYKMDKHNTLVYGMEFKNQKAAGTGIGGAGNGGRKESYLGMTSPYGSASQNTYAFYLEDEMRLGDKLLFVPSLRFDHHDSFGSEWSPRAGLTYQFSKASRLKLNYGKAYRAPSIFELYANFDHAPVPQMHVHVNGNPDLKPEKSTNFDVSLEGEKGKATGKLTYFHNKISDMISTQSDFYGFNPRYGGMTSISHYVNVDKATLQGAEAEATYQFDKHWSVRANYTYLDAKDGGGQRLSDRALNTGTVELSWTDAKKDPLTATLYTQWYQNYLTRTQKRVRGNRVTVEDTYSYALTNFVVTKNIGNLSLYAGVDNLFNKTFKDSDSLWTEGRLWRAGAEWKF